MHRSRVVILLLAVGLGACPPALSQTPWVVLGRRALGRVQQLTQEKSGAVPGFDVASVLLDALAERVYATAVATVRKNKSLRVVSEDTANHRLEFAEGEQRGTFSVVALGDNLSQMLIAANVVPGQGSTTSRAVEAVLRVCREMHKHCSVEG